MLGMMSRTEDTVRVLRPHRRNTSEDTKELALPSVLPPNHGSSVRDAHPPQSNKSQPAIKPLTQEETVELIRRAVENALHETQRSLPGSEAVDDVVRPKLTIDLGHSNIDRIPESVVDIIKAEVARLSFANNRIDHIPPRFSECIHLRYLNIRANNFTQFPKGVYNLSFLEILDLSRNKITKIPEDIRKLTSLQFLSMVNNLLDDLPSQIANMNKLQILKVQGNSLKYPLKHVLDLKERDVASSELTDNEKDIAITAELKRFLKSRQTVVAPDTESSNDSSGHSDSVLDTPKPMKRGNRFPVIPRPNGTESAHDSRQPSVSRPPPIPTRSHHRISSGQGAGLYNGIMHRAPQAPISGASERNRSNSEGFIQASTSSRGRRMGLISRKNTDLGRLDEIRPYRNSHLRGLSHGSVLRSKTGGAGSGGSSSSSPSSPRERWKLREVYVHRMSSLPEHKLKVTARLPITESAKGILYSLFQIHPHISSLINVIKDEDAKRNSLEIVFYNASTHMHQLNEALENAEKVDLQDLELGKKAAEAVKRECETCIMAYIHVGTQVRNNINKLVPLGDPRYIRSLMLMIYGSLIELRNACASLAVDLPFQKASNPMGGKMPVPEPKEEPASDTLAEPSATPTRELHQPIRRLRSDTTIQHPQAVPTSHCPPSNPVPPNFSNNFNATSVPPNLGLRSRSSSRSNTMLNSPGPPSFANTPRSGESFGNINSSSMSRINPMTGLDELEEERIFEKIFFQLTSAYTSALQALPLVSRQFSQCLEAAEQSRAPQELRTLWTKLIYRCRVCLDVSEALHVRLSSMKVKEPGGGIRSEREFWQLCKTFIQAFVELVTDMREAKNLRLLPSDIVITLRPVQKANKEAGRLIDASPWSYLAELNTSNPTSIYPAQLQTHHLQHYSGLSGSTLTNALSPQSVALPATPLSAALGPAAQATVPSTPASAYSDRFFAGDVFQRADSLLSMPSALPLFYRR